MEFRWRYPLGRKRHREWRAIEGEEAVALEGELRRETVADHVLFGRIVRAVARRDDCDDVAFIVDGEHLCIVHLTWTHEREPAWPHVQFVTALPESDEEEGG